MNGKICSLVEFTAHFFYAGDTASAAELEDMFWDGDYADVTNDIPKAVLDDDLADDVIFEEDACAITHRLIHEGRCDYGYSTCTPRRASRACENVAALAHPMQH